MEDLSIYIQPFLIGLGVGLILLLVVYVSERGKRGSLKKEINSLKNHLHNKMEIEAEATENRRLEIERLKKENENLRITNQTLAQKPGRREVMNLHVYQKAIAIMTESAQGFAPMWQRALREAEAEIEKSDEGSSSFIRKIIPTQIFGSSTSDRKKLDSGDEYDETRS
uniref:Uncharacterized protein n=1 Tax=Roseihalotalea indica TaxID=2867963 RepID=A0AA49GNL2_9BACT|nr:hypothetical protein K4G66_02165 [Tunicatimonas sp. TK19036]